VDALVDLFRRDVAGALLEETQDKLALRGEAQPSLPQDPTVHARFLEEMFSIFINNRISFARRPQ